ncbi:MAG: glutathione S-transferase family protein [Acidiferrobacteraceae bacterium]
MIIFYRNTASPNIQKISLMFAETQLPHEVQSVDREPDGTLVSSFRAINPNATLPAILDQDNGISVFESGAILYYLAEKSGQFLPTGLGPRTAVMKWLMFEVANVGPVMGELYHYLLSESQASAESHLPRYRDKLIRYCTLLDRQLEGQRYLCGDYSIADMALYHWCGILEDIAEIHLGDYANLSRWVATIGARPATQATLTTRPITAGS